MGQDIVFEYRNDSETKARDSGVSTSAHSNGNVKECERKGQKDRYYRLKSLNSDFRELNRSQSSCLHHEYMSSKSRAEVEDSMFLKRGSMYQSSKEVRRMRKLREGRRKEDCSGSDDAFLSFEIVDSLPPHGSSKAVLLSHQRCSPLVSSKAESKLACSEASEFIKTKSTDFLDLSFQDLPDKNLNSPSIKQNSHSADQTSSDDLLEICLNKTTTEAASSMLEAVPKSVRSQNTRLHVKPVSERDLVDAIPKSFSAKAGMSRASFQSECHSAVASPKTRFSPFKKMLEPIMKSKSARQASLLQLEHANVATDPTSIRRNAVLPKSLLSDFSKATEKLYSDEPLIREEEVLETASSPVHLHGVLKLETENGNPAFEFAVKDPEDVLSAKTWKTDNAYTWVYTFHSSKRKNTSGKSSKDKHGQPSSMVGQMHVSCYLCSEMRENGSLANSTVAEFVLYDIVQARRSFTVEERSQCSIDSIQSVSGNVIDNFAKDALLERSDSIECRNPAKCAVSSSEAETSTSCPWPPVDLHPQLETAAIVIQIPFNKKEKLKEVIIKDNENLSSSPAADIKTETCHCPNSAAVKVVTPNGSHGVPVTDEGGPNTLLDRWRFGGSCDCGGWDMGCPIAVFDKPQDNNLDKTSEGKKPLLLFLQGSKEKIPALSVMADSKGQYSVDFHARFSALQAFSICLAILHTFESSSSAALDQKNRQRFFSNSLKLLLEEEVRQLIEAVAIEKKRKEDKRVERIPPSFFLDPPFSPIGRV